MSKIKFSGLGWEGYTGQIARIKDGIESLGHVATHDDPDLVFCNDPVSYTHLRAHETLRYLVCREML